MRILLIEDENGLMEALKTVLENENYLIDSAGDGKTGLEYALTGIYDVIVLDIMIPKINGIEVLNAIRKEKIRTSVLLLTAKTDIEDKIAGLDSGADDYMTKPFHTEELLARIRALLRRKKEARENIIMFGDLILKQDTRKLFCQKQSVKLGLKEFLLLETLMINNRQILTKEQLTEKVWGTDSNSDYNNVEVYASFIRKKISFIESKVKVRVNRGLGYFLEMESVD